MLTRIVRTGLASTVSTPAMPAAWTTWVHPARRRGEPGQVEHVALDEVEVRVVAEVGAREGVAMEVVERDHLVVVDEPPRERRADEAGSARDQDPLAAQSHAASLAAYPRGTMRRRLPRALRSPSRARRMPGCRLRRPDLAADRVPRRRRLRRPASSPCGAPTGRREPCLVRRSPAAGCSGSGADAFRPTPPAAACTEISGGPSTARVTGSLPRPPALGQLGRRGRL